MKRVAFILLAGLAVLTTSCNKEKKLNNIEGTWASVEAKEEYKGDGEKESAAYSFSSSLICREDKSFSWDEMYMEGTYDISRDGKSLVFTSSGVWGTDTDTWNIDKLSKNKMIISQSEDYDGDTYKVSVEFAKM